MLTKRQQEVYDFLKDYHQSTGLMPSTREIQKHFKFASQTAAVSHLRALEKKGVIQKHAFKARALVLPEELERDEIVDVPIYGSIAAGMAQETDQEQNGCLSVDITSLGIPRNAKTFAVRAAVRAVDRAMQTHRAMGFTNELGLTEAYHVLRVINVADGTNEILNRTIFQRLAAGDTDL